MNKTKAIVYDMDNTIYPQLVDITQRIEHCIKIFSLPMPENIKSFWINEWLENGPEKSNLIDRIIRRFFLKVDKNSFLLVYRSYKTKLSLENEISGLFINNKAKDIKQFIITNGYTETQLNKIDSLDLEKFVDEIIIAKGEYAKPSNHWFLELLKKYNLEPAECLSVGDWYAVDGAASESAGVPFIYKEGGPIKETVPRHIKKIQKLTEIEEYIT